MSAARAWVSLLGACAALVALATVGCTATSPPSSGGCPAAPISADVSTVRPGDQVVLSADYAAYAGCFDHFVNGAPQTPTDPGGVYRDVEIVWAQDGKETVLARVDADANNQLRATVAVPAAAPTGLATLNARSADNVIVVVQPADR